MSLCLFSCTRCTEEKKTDDPEKEQTPPTPEPEALEPVIVAYVTYWDSVIPDPSLVTHVNYAFAHVKNTFNAIEIQTESRLKKICELKKQNTNLKVLVSVGGWGAGNFSEMAANAENRKLFCADCLAKCKVYGLDGIDLDWEYPTVDWAGISSSPSDTRNFTALLKDLRDTLGDKYLITMASSADAKYVNFKDCIQYLDFVNLMDYDMGRPPKHHSALYPSPMTSLSVDESVALHLKAGVPAEKIVVGAPFYGKGKDSSEDVKYNGIGSLLSKYTEKWDDTAKVPYLVDSSGEMVFCYDNVRSIGLKTDYVIEKGLRGMMFWSWEGDNTTTWEMTHAIYDKLLK